MSAVPTRSPEPGDVVRTMFRGDPTRGIVQSVEQAGEPRSPVLAQVYAVGGSIFDRRLVAAVGYEPEEGEWAW